MKKKIDIVSSYIKINSLMAIAVILYSLTDRLPTPTSPVGFGHTFYERQFGFLISNICIFIIFISLMILLVSFLSRRNNKAVLPSAYKYLATFSICASLWTISDGPIIKQFLANNSFLYYVSFFSYCFMPVYFALFVNSLCKTGKKLTAKVIFALNIAITLCTLLHIFRVFDLSISLYLIHILVFLVILCSTVLCMIDHFKYSNKQTKLLYYSLLALSTVSCISFIDYFFTLIDFTLYFEYSILLFLITLNIFAVSKGSAYLIQYRVYNDLISSVQCGVCRFKTDDELTIVYANNFFYKMFGYTAEEAQKAGFVNAAFNIHPEDAPRYKELILKNIASKKTTFELEYRKIKRDGSIIYILCRCHYREADNGEITSVLLDISKRKSLEEQLRISEEAYRIAAQQSDKIILLFEIATKIAYLQNANSTNIPSIFDNVPHSLIEHELIAPESREECLKFFEAMHKGDPQKTSIARFKLNQKMNYAWYRADYTMLFDNKGKPLHAIISISDITEMREKEVAFERWKQDYLSMSPELTMYSETNLSQNVIERIEGNIFPCIPEECSGSVSGIVLYIADNFLHIQDRQAFLDFFNNKKILTDYQMGINTASFEFRRVDSQNNKLWTRANIQVITDPYNSDIKMFILIKDIDELKRAELTLEQRSKEDPLTSLLNRNAFVEKFNEIVQQSHRDEVHTFLIIDVDNFKYINDTLGHAAGDKVLIEISRNLKNAVRKDDICGRLGGDEFIVLLRNIDYGEELTAILDRLLASINEYKVVRDKISISIGITKYPYDGVFFEDLYQKSDIALYKAKKAGKNNYAFYK